MSDDKISSNPAIDEALRLDGDPEKLDAYYRGWANRYDLDVADAGYRGPEIAGRMLRDSLPPGNSSLLDAGCGTGLVGRELGRLGYFAIDGFDLSEAMAERARDTGCYRRVLGGIDIMRAAEYYADGSYDALLSVGVFTLGHVPPEALEVLLRLVRPGGLLVISTRTQYYERSGIRELLDALLGAGELALSARLDDAPYNRDGAAHYFSLRRPG